MNSVKTSKRNSSRNFSSNPRKSSNRNYGKKSEQILGKNFCINLESIEILRALAGKHKSRETFYTNLDRNSSLDFF